MTIEEAKSEHTTTQHNTTHSPWMGHKLNIDIPNISASTHHGLRFLRKRGSIGHWEGKTTGMCQAD
jgi:hypothetical protein